MKKFNLVVILLILVSISLNAKSKSGRINITLPQFSSPSSNGVSFPIGSGLSPYFYTNPAYQNFILGQYNLNAINSRLPQPQSDLGNQILDKHIQSEIAEEIRVQPIQSGNAMPVYRITNIIDHGNATNSKDPKFKHVDFLLWKFQTIEEGIPVQVNGSQLEFGNAIVFTDKPESLLKFVTKEKENYFLLETRDNRVLTGLLVNTKSKKVTRVQCFKVQNESRETYDHTILSDEVDFWSYLALFNK
ncbi:MAG: hypothetical protein KBA66_01425 [Leptospiraceae bacterium]|nr:hypothetical protein [Leptospiraceae bacterium]